MNSILLVDDETIICAEFARTLEGLGFEVEVAPTVESGLSRSEEAHFDAILVEFNLTSEWGAHPRTGGGVRLIRDLRKSGKRIPILVYTAMEGETYQAASLDAGADDYILKRSPISDFFSRLREHIRMRGVT